VPAVATRCSWALAALDEGPSLDPWQDIELPAQLGRAVPRRQRQFRAGRFCALEALRRLEPERTFSAPGRLAGGAPLWPEGTTGSITHTDDFASAAVARTVDLIALGIDTERVVPDARAAAVASVVSRPFELDIAREAGCDAAQALTLVFSAKESIFKCLHPIVHRWFGFHDVRLVRVDARTRTFEVRVTTALSDAVPADTMLQGRFELDATHVHTGIAVTRDMTPGVVSGGGR
jgi:enterobactin synthetase component D